MTGLQESPQFVAADVGILEQARKSTDRHCAPSQWHTQRSMSGWMDVDLVAATTTIMLPALAFQGTDELSGREPRELVAHAAAGASLRCSTVGNGQPRSCRDSR